MVTTQSAATHLLGGALLLLRCASASIGLALRGSWGGACWLAAHSTLRSASRLPLGR